MATGANAGSYTLEQHRKMTLDFIRIKQSLDIVVFLSRINSRQRSPESLTACEPSWIPDWLEKETWSDPRKKAYLRGKIFLRSVTRGYVQGRRKWNSALGSKPAVKVVGNSLHCKGLIIDTIRTLTTTFLEETRTPAKSEAESRTRQSSTQPHFPSRDTTASPTPSSYEDRFKIPPGSSPKTGAPGAEAFHTFTPPPSTTTSTASPSSEGESTPLRQGSVALSQVEKREKAPNPGSPAEGEAYRSKASVYMAVFHLLNYHLHLPLGAEANPAADAAKSSQIPFACEHIAFLSLFANLSNWKRVKATTPELTRWVKLNREFPIKIGEDDEVQLVLSEYLRHPQKSFYDFLRKKNLGDQDVRVALMRTQMILSFGRRLALTKGAGYLGWVPAATAEGDVLALLAGCSVPVVMRPRPEGGYLIVGDGHFHGLMDGEGMAGRSDTESWPFVEIY